MYQNTATATKKVSLTQFELSNLIRKTKLFSKIKLTQSARLVLESLVFHYPNIRVNVKTLQEETGNGRTSVLNALKELKEKGLILITQTGRSSIFNLTQKFFDLLDVELQKSKKQYSRSSNIELLHNKHDKKENKKDFNNFNFYKNGSFNKVSHLSDERERRKYHHDTHIIGMNYKKYKHEPLPKGVTPMDFNRDDALSYLQGLPKILHNSVFTRKLIEKWGFSPAEIDFQPLNII